MDQSENKEFLCKELEKMGQNARKGALAIANASAEEKNRWLNAMADALEKECFSLFSPNVAPAVKNNIKKTKNIFANFMFSSCKNRWVNSNF